MRLRGISLITKGILAKVKAVGLATKGILDELVRVRAGGQPTGYLLDKFYDIKGIKQFSLELFYDIKGIKLFYLKDSYIVVVIKEILLDSSYKIKALVERKLQVLSLTLKGKRQLEITRCFLSKGIKQIDLLSDLLLSGIKQDNFALDRNIKAGKSFKSFDTGAFLEIEIDKKFPIRGKREVTNILMALDILN